MRLVRLLKRDLAHEIAGWVEGDLISIEQARSICGVYGVDYDAIKNYSFGYQLLVGLGYLFIGLALITLIGANWDEIPRGLRMGGLVALTVGVHGFGLRAYHLGKEARAVGLFLLGNIFYGSSIILIAQIYHLGEHMPDGIFWWALGSLPFGLLLRNPWLTLFSSALALIWFFTEYVQGFYPALFPLFIAGGLFILIKGRPSTLLFLTTVVSIGLWLELTLAMAWDDGYSQFSRFDLQAEHVFVTVGLFIFAYAVSGWLHAKDSIKAKDYGAILSLWALRFALITMLVLSFEAPWRSMIEANWDHQASMWPLMLLLFGSSLWLGWGSNKLDVIGPVIAFAGLSMLAVMLVSVDSNALYFQLAYNIALVGWGTWLMVLGIRCGVSHYFFLGVATILLTGFMRYIDLIGEYIGGAILFMAMAGILLGAARFWRNDQLKRAAA